jgi:hypothetical protein
MDSKMDPLRRGYRANTSRKRSAGLCTIGQGSRKGYGFEKWMLTVWIRIWVFLLLGIIAVPMAVLEIVEMRTEKGAIREPIQHKEFETEDERQLKKHKEQRRQLQRQSILNMDQKQWKGDNFSQSREPKETVSSSPPLEGLSPIKTKDYDPTSVYEDSDGEGIGVTPGTGEGSQLRPPPFVLGGEKGERESTWKERRGMKEEREKGVEGEQSGRPADLWSNLPAINLIQILPLPGALGAPNFEGKNVTEFIQRMEDLFEDCRVGEGEKRGKIVRYCSRDVRRRIERMPEFQEERFRLPGFIKALKFQYRDHDDIQRRYTIKSLDEAVREGALLPEQRLEEFLDKFHDISAELADRGILSPYDRGIKFMRGLPSPMRQRIGERHHFNPMDPESVDYRQYYQTAIRMYRDRKNIRELDGENPHEPTSSQPSSREQGGRTILTRPSMPHQDHQPEDDLVSKFLGLQLNASEVRSRLNKADQIQKENEELRRILDSNNPPSRQPYRSNFNQIQGFGVNAMDARYGRGRYPNSSKDQRKCFMCWNEPGVNGEVFPHHSHVKDCPLYGRFMEIRTCWYDSDNEDRSKRGLYWGIPYGKGMRIPLKSYEPYWKQVVELSKGTEYDANVENREAYLQRLERSRPQMDPESYSRTTQAPSTLGTAASPAVDFNVIDVINDGFEDFGRLTYEELAATVEEEERFVVDSHALSAEILDVAAVKTRAQTRRETDDARAILKERQQKESKYAKPKRMKPAAMVPHPEVMDYDMVEPEEVKKDEGGSRKKKAVSFSDQQNELSEVPAIAGGSLKSREPTLESSPISVRRPYQGLTSAYGAADILLSHFARSKMDISVAQYIATSKEGRDFLAKGLKEIDTPEVQRRTDPKLTVDASSASIGEYSRWPVVPERQDEPMGNGERRVYPSPHLPVTIFGPDRGTKLAAMMDSGAAINMISRALCDRLGLQMLSAVEYDMRPVKGPRSELDGVVDNVSILVGGVAFKVSFFVMSGANHHCILGQPFKMTSGIKLSATPDGMDGPEYAELYDSKRELIVKMQCARPLRRRVLPASELLEDRNDQDAESSSEEN